MVRSNVEFLATLGDVLRGIVNQQLVMAKDGTGRFAVREALTIDYKIDD